MPNEQAGCAIQFLSRGAECDQATLFSWRNTGIRFASGLLSEVGAGGGEQQRERWGENGKNKVVNL